MLKRNCSRLGKNRRSPRTPTLLGAKRYLGIDQLEERRLLTASYPPLVPQALGGLDFGDAPNTYGTLLASDGARHTTTGLFLGATADDELDAQAPLDGTGDDASVTDDEDGVTISPMAPGGFARAAVTVSLAGRLDAWVDFNGNGAFDPAEQIATNLAVAAGANNINFNIPAAAVEGNTFARFRLSTIGGLAPTGAAADGELEDYAVTIACPTTVYVDDNFAGLNPGDDPAGPATAFGFDAFATIQQGVNVVCDNGTVNVNSGVYAENVVVNHPIDLVSLAPVTLNSLTSTAGTSLGLSGDWSSTTGNFTFNGPVALIAATSLATGGNVVFANTVNGPGSLAISNLGTTTLGAAVGTPTPLASLFIDSHGPLVISNNITATGDISISVQETVPAAAGDDLTVNAGVTIQSTTGFVQLRAGDNLTVAAGSTVQAGTNVQIAGDFNSNDGQGTTINVQGSLVGAPVTIFGNNDPDTFNITSSSTVIYQVDGHDPATLPGDTLNLDLTGFAASKVQVVGYGQVIVKDSPGNRVQAKNIETVNSTAGKYDLCLLTTQFDGGLGVPIGNDGSPDTIDARLNAAGDRLELRVNGVLAFSGEYDTNTVNSDINTLEIVGSSDADLFQITEVNNRMPRFPGNLVGISQSGTAHTNGAMASSVPNPATIGIHFDAAGDVDAASDDTFRLTSTQLHNVSYFSDDDFSANSGVINVQGDFSLSFADLTPIVLVGAGGTLTVDATSTPATTTLNIVDLLPAGDGISQITGNGGFETTTFSGYSALVVRGGDGGETITLESIDPADPDAGGPGSALTTVTITGDNTTNTDPSDDTINVRSLPASVTANLFGGAGNDTFNVGSNANPALSTLDPILGIVNVNGNANLAAPTTTLSCGAASNTLAVGDTLNINDNATALASTYQVTATFVRRTVAPLNFVNYSTIETLNLTAGTGNDTIDVTAAASVNTSINGNLGNDTINLLGSGASANVVINGEDGADTINVSATGAGSITMVNGQAGNDTINIGNNLSTILGPICVDGGTHDAAPTTTLTCGTASNTLAVGDTLNINDPVNAVPGSYTVTPTAVQRTAPASAPIEYVAIETLSVTTGTNNDTINVTAAASVNTTINSGAGNDSINLIDAGTNANVVLNAGDNNDLIRVQGAGAGSIVLANGENGQDDARVGTVGGTLDNIRGAVCADGGSDASWDSLYIDDFNDLDAHNYAINGDTVRRSNGGTIDIKYMNQEALVLNAGQQSDTIRVQDTNPVTKIALVGGAGGDIFRIGSGPFSPLRTLDTIHHEIIVIGGSDGSWDSLFVDDQDDTTNNQYTVTSTQVTRVDGAVTITYSEIEALVPTAGSGDDLMRITSTAVGTTTAVQMENGSDIVRVGTVAGSMDTIVSPVIVDGGNDGLWDSLFLDDFADADANTYTVTSTEVTRTAVAPVVSVRYTNIEALVLNAGTNNDTINIRSTNAATTTAIVAGPGNDTINVSSTAPAGGGNLNGIASRLIIDTGTDLATPLVLSTQTVTRVQSPPPPPDGLGPCPVVYNSFFTPTNQGVLVGDTINVSDEGLAVRALYTVGAINVGTPTATQRISRTSQVGGPAVSSVNIEYRNAETLNLTTGTAANDQINVQLVTPPVSATNPALPVKMSFDGGNGGGDFLTVQGTSAADSITVGSAGIPQRSQIELARMEFFKFFGGAGNDSLAAANLGPGTQTWMLGQGDNDTLVGGQASDTFEGGPGNDIAFGNDGEDLLVGGPGEDELHGGAGDDVLFGGPGYDGLYGDQNNDFIFADQDVTVTNFHDFSLAYTESVVGCEFVDGGAGTDTVVALGEEDQINNAERFVETGAVKNVFTWLRGSAFGLEDIASFIAQARNSLNN